MPCYYTHRCLRKSYNAGLRLDLALRNAGQSLPPTATFLGYRLIALQNGPLVIMPPGTPVAQKAPLHRPKGRANQGAILLLAGTENLGIVVYPRDQGWRFMLQNETRAWTQDVLAGMLHRAFEALQLSVHLLKSEAWHKTFIRKAQRHTATHELELLKRFSVRCKKGGGRRCPENVVSHWNCLLGMLTLCKRRQNADTAREIEEALMLSNLQISDMSRQPSSAAQWLARKTQSIFGKSKSCTDLKEIDKQMTHKPAGMEIKWGGNLRCCAEHEDLCCSLVPFPCSVFVSWQRPPVQWGRSHWWQAVCQIFKNLRLFWLDVRSK